jgi:DNA-binding response OmpR family regulator
MKTIAVIEDDVHISDMLFELLSRERYRVLRAYSGTEALYLLSQQEPDLILLDLMLPGLSGEELLRRIQGTPVIVLSAKLDVEDKVKALLSGAADYMTKPFDPQELLARITVQFRITEGSNAASVLRSGELSLDLNAQIAAWQGKNVKLTLTEFAILKLLMQNPKQVFSKNALLNRISFDTPDCTERSLKQHISNLRKKLQEAGAPDLVETVWGIGFRLAELKS